MAGPAGKTSSNGGPVGSLGLAYRSEHQEGSIAYGVQGFGNVRITTQPFQFKLGFEINQALHFSDPVLQRKWSPEEVWSSDELPNFHQDYFRRKDRPDIVKGVEHGKELSAGRHFLTFEALFKPWKFLGVGGRFEGGFHFERYWSSTTIYGDSPQKDSPDSVDHTDDTDDTPVPCAPEDYPCDLYVDDQQTPLPDTPPDRPYGPYLRNVSRWTPFLRFGPSVVWDIATSPVTVTVGAEWLFETNAKAPNGDLDRILRIPFAVSGPIFKSAYLKNIHLMAQTRYIHRWSTAQSGPIERNEFDLTIGAFFRSE